LIIVTGASGKTGKMIVKALTKNNLPVRAIVRKEEQLAILRGLGASEVIVGDLTNKVMMDLAFSDARAIYHICPNMHPKEVEIGGLMIHLAQKHDLAHFVYHSVLHPQVEAMPHHWNKMLVEDQLLRMKIPFTILQPAAYMQNVLGYLKEMLELGEYRIPYSIYSKSSMIDLNDLAEVVIKVFSEPGHEHAIYELSAREPISAVEIAAVVSKVTGTMITAGMIDRVDWEINARAAGLPDYAVKTLIKMFQYYDEYGFVGNGNQLSWLLEREPNSFEQFIRNEFKN